jgi:hypothetical protein
MRKLNMILLFIEMHYFVIIFLRFPESFYICDDELRKSRKTS